MSETTSSAAGIITLERTYSASIDELWALWTTKEGFESWWGPEGFRVEVQRLDARAGGVLEYEMIADAPEQVAAMKQMGMPTSHHTRAHFADVRPQQHIAITHLIDFVPGVAAYESKATVDFAPAGDQVRMTIVLERLHDEQWTRNAVEGWTSQLRKLDARQWRSSQR